jgi:hypothetical protein
MFIYIHTNTHTRTWRGWRADCAPPGLRTTFPTTGSVLAVRGSVFRVWGLELSVQGFEFRVQGLGFRILNMRFRVQNLWFRGWGSGCRLQGLGFRVWDLGLRGQVRSLRWRQFETVTFKVGGDTEPSAFARGAAPSRCVCVCVCQR